MTKRPLGAVSIFLAFAHVHWMLLWARDAIVAMLSRDVARGVLQEVTCVVNLAATYII